MTNTQEKQNIIELLKDYNGYDFCGEIGCSGQGKANELVEGLTRLIESAKQEGAIEELEAINAASDKNYYFTCDEYDSYIQDRLAQLKQSEESE